MEKLKVELQKAMASLEIKDVPRDPSIVNRCALNQNQNPNGMDWRLNIAKDLEVPMESDDQKASERNVLTQIPPFYSQKLKENDIIQLRIREHARSMHITRKSEGMLNQEELTELYSIFEKYANPPFAGDNDVKFIGFRSYKKMVETLNENCQQLLTTPDGHPAFISLLTDDPFMRVPIETLFNYVMRKTWLLQTRMQLSLYDDTGEGFIKELQFENYIRDLIPTLTLLKGIDTNFLPFYVCTAAAKFFFFLDPNRTRKLKIVDILASCLIDEVLDLRERDPSPVPNWFSWDSTHRIYTHFMQLDRDKSGMLSADEFLYYSIGEMNLTPAFVNRIFEEFLTYDNGQMDFRTYAELALAFENPREIQSLKMYFRLLDIDKKGYLDAFTLQYFYKDILNMMTLNNTERVSFENVKDEMFDMIKPVDPLKITFDDLIRSGKGHVLFSVFTDFNGFYAHEYRDPSSETGS